MRIAISGVRGYMSKNLCAELNKLHHTIIPLERHILYDKNELIKRIADTEVVINLAGAPILQRWTKTNKSEIYISRIETTKNITNAINNLPDQKKPKLFISASAIGIYTSNLVHTEESELFSSDFVGKVVNDWEKASAELSPAVRKVIFRIAPVIGKEAQIINKILPIFKAGLGGKIGTGKQPFPFIHITDVVNAILWSIQNPEAQGIYNLSAPENITNKQFTRTMSKLIGIPAFFTIPGFVIKLAYGKAASLLLESPIVYPQRLINAGFIFIYPDIHTCLNEIIH